MALTIDTRTATEYGVVRTFGQGDFQFNNFGSSNPATLSRVPGRIVERAVRPWRRLCRSRVRLSPVRRLHLRQVRLGLCHAVAGLSLATSPRTCSAARTPTPASTTFSTPPSSATAYRPRSVSMIRPCGTAPPSTTWASPVRSAPTAPDRTPMPARMRPKSSAGSGSIRLGVSSRFRPRRMRSVVRSTRWQPARCRTTCPKSAATPTPNGVAL